MGQAIHRGATWGSDNGPISGQDRGSVRRGVMTTERRARMGPVLMTLVVLTCWACAPMRDPDPSTDDPPSPRPDILYEERKDRDPMDDPPQP